MPQGEIDQCIETIKTQQKSSLIMKTSPGLISDVQTSFCRALKWAGFTRAVIRAKFSNHKQPRAKKWWSFIVLLICFVLQLKVRPSWPLTQTLTWPLTSTLTATQILTLTQTLTPTLTGTQTPTLSKLCCSVIAWTECVSLALLPPQWFTSLNLLAHLHF